MLLLAAMALLLILLPFEGSRSVPRPGYDVRFGIIEPDANGYLDIAAETTTIPLLYQQTGFSFGYSVDPPDDLPYLTSEVLHLPQPPLHIEFNMPFEQQDGGRIIRTSQVARQYQSIYPYSFSPGDPVGRWRLDVYINGEMARTIRFDVVAAKSFNGKMVY